jgi:D-alanine-D-alanine ligase
MPDDRRLTIRVPGSSDRANDIYIEWDTMETINAVRDAIKERYSVLMIEVNEDACQKLLKIRPDFAFNMSEGLYGASREAQVPAILEMLRIPYLGSDPLTLSLCLDKSRAKEILSYHGIPTPRFTVIRSMNGYENVRVKFPAIVKPLHEGSSKGIYNSCVVRTTEELEREVRIVLTTYNQPALVEEFLSGREFTVALLGNGDDIRTLPIVEVKFDSLPPDVNPIYSYEAKWIWDTTDKPLEIFQCPADLEEDMQIEIETICKDAYKVLNCRDWSRIDVRLDAEGNPNILEINPLPGILPKPEDNSCFPKAARVAGMSYNQLINNVLDIAMERCGLRVRHQKHLSQAEVMA